MECVIKAHVSKARRDAEVVGLEGVQDVNGAPQVVRHQEVQLEDLTWHLLWLTPRGTPLSECVYNADVARRVAATCVAVLEHAHGKGFVHRDVTPSNVLVRADGSVVLNDWGSVRRLGAPNSEDGTTPGFDRPEHLRGAPWICEPADDWWGLACTLLAYGRARKSLDLSQLTHHERVGRVLAWTEYAAGAYDVFRQAVRDKLKVDR